MKRTASVALWCLLPPVIVAALYLFGTRHTPDFTTGLFGAHGTDAVDLKARLGSALFCLALVQLLLAVWMYRRPSGSRGAPGRVRAVHRVIGVGALVLSLPIAYHCIVTYGIETTDTRVAVHSLAGCGLYGAFAAKILVVRSRRLPGWALPVAGGVLVAVIALLWYTAALWALNGYSVPGFQLSAPVLKVRR